MDFYGILKNANLAERFGFPFCPTRLTRARQQRFTVGNSETRGKLRNPKLNRLGDLKVRLTFFTFCSILKRYIAVGNGLTGRGFAILLACC